MIEMTFEENCIELAGCGESTFNEFKNELFGKHLVSGDKALYALSLAFNQCSRHWDVEEAFVNLLPLFTESNPFEEIDDLED